MHVWGWVVCGVAVVGLSAAGGIYTASRTGDPLTGAAFGLGFGLVFALVLWRATRSTGDERPPDS